MEMVDLRQEMRQAKNSPASPRQAFIAVRLQLSFMAAAGVRTLGIKIPSENSMLGVKMATFKVPEVGITTHLPKGKKRPYTQVLAFISSFYTL